MTGAAPLPCFMTRPCPAGARPRSASALPTPVLVPLQSSMLIPGNHAKVRSEDGYCPSSFRTVSICLSQEASQRPQLRSIVFWTMYPRCVASSTYLSRMLLNLVGNVFAMEGEIIVKQLDRGSPLYPPHPSPRSRVFFLHYGAPRQEIRVTGPGCPR